ncbi:flagellar hook-basal body complex protein FliE [Acidovorax sp. Be4]|uniref:Flagellar hook-basal body complex protein FliE n=1 Tax=Acidovorax bellezanensis TaxID=2976702 RepID=A0ABT2PQ71_9BURK|nr:flagellar hook-basal body complex protein FliE [Acidovorax sp. Be4]MCT9812623.1 flagellar hook-basal body complex protein FliE [Acidovorax sp. Be4]
MDLRINTSTFPISGTDLPRRVAATPTPTRELDGGFSHALKGALQSVSAAQDHSSNLQREVQLENPAVSLEETMVAIQKAQIGFQASLHVRNRLVQAYTDVMNMQV